MEWKRNKAGEYTSDGWTIQKMDVLESTAWVVYDPHNNRADVAETLKAAKTSVENIIQLVENEKAQADARIQVRDAELAQLAEAIESAPAEDELPETEPEAEDITITPADEPQKPKGPSLNSIYNAIMTLEDIAGNHVHKSKVSVQRAYNVPAIREDLTNRNIPVNIGSQMFWDTVLRNQR